MDFVLVDTEVGWESMVAIDCASRHRTISFIQNCKRMIENCALLHLSNIDNMLTIWSINGR